MLQDHTTNTISVEDAYYHPPRNGQPAQVSVDFTVHRRPGTGEYLVDQATAMLGGGTDQVAGTIESLATEHLRTTTGTSARISEDGYTITIHTDLRNADARSNEPAGLRVHDADDTGPVASLTAAQTAALPGIEKAIHDALPTAKQHHQTKTLALHIAQELPTPAQVIDAYYRPTLAEVLHAHEQRHGASLDPVMPLRTYLASFPQPATTALAGPTEPAHTPSSATRATARSVRGLDR